MHVQILNHGLVQGQFMAIHINVVTHGSTQSTSRERHFHTPELALHVCRLKHIVHSVPFHPRTSAVAVEDTIHLGFHILGMLEAVVRRRSLAAASPE